MRQSLRANLREALIGDTCAVSISQVLLFSRVKKESDKYKWIMSRVHAPPGVQCADCLLKGTK